MNRWHSSVLTVGALMLAACATPPPGRSPAPGTGAARPVPGAAPSAPASAARRGGYYLDDGPGETPPADLAAIPDALPRLEPLHRWANRPYVVFDRQYVPMTRLEPFRERGIGSWYGRKFHGQRTASGEVYDMYAMTAAHPTLPIPSYVRVTHTRSGRSVVVRVNDRGPFLHGRVIDLSWTAAAKLGYAQGGSGEVEVELLDPAGFADAGPAGVRAGAPALPPLAMMAIADTPQRIVPLAGGAGGALQPAAGQGAGAPWQGAAAGSASAAASAGTPHTASAASAPATAAPVTAAPGAAAAASSATVPGTTTAPGTTGSGTTGSGTTTPGTTTPGTTGPATTGPGAQAPRAAESAPPERLDVETVIAPAPPAPPPAPRPSNLGSAPATGTVGAASASDVGAPATGAAPSAAPAPASAATALPARAGMPALAPGAALPPGQVLYLQIGAFAQRDNALAARSRAAAVLGMPAERFQLRSGEGSLIKVLAGPFTQRADALAAADKLRQSTDLRPVPALLPR